MLFPPFTLPASQIFSELGEQFQQRDPAVRGPVFLRLPDRDREHPQRGVQPPDRHLRQGGVGEDPPLQRNGDGAVRTAEGPMGFAVVQPRPGQLRRAHRRFCGR